MKDLLPLTSNDNLSIPDNRDPQFLEIDDADANTVFSALSSETARQILNCIYEEPRTPSDVASTVDTSLQNTNYHLNKLRESGFIEVVGTRYSEQGREMDVYAPTNGPLIIYAGAEATERSLGSALKRLLGAVGIFGLIGALVNRVAVGVFGGSSGGLITTDSSGSTVVIGDDPWVYYYHLKNALTSPGGLLFVTGVLLSVLCFIVWYRRRYRTETVVVG